MEDEVRALRAQSEEAKQTQAKLREAEAELMDLRASNAAASQSGDRAVQDLRQQLEEVQQ